MVASRGRRWCWWLAGSSVVVPGVGGWPSSSGLSAAVWAVVTQPAVVSGSSAHPALAAPKLQWCGACVEQDSDPGSGVGQKWRPQQAYGSNQFLLVQPQTVFSTHTKSSRSRIDKRTARATGNTRYRYNKIAPLDHKMADNCVSLARTNTLSSTITKLIKTSKTSNKRYSYHLLNRINKMYTHDLFYLQQEWEAWLAPVYIQIRTTKSQLTQCTKYNCH